MASSVKGLDRLTRQLRSLPTAVVEEMALALGDGASDLAAAIRRAARGNRLKASIDHGTHPPATRATGAFRPPPAEISSLRAARGLTQFVWAGDDDAFWARWDEYGTAPHSVAKGSSRKSHKGQDAGPHHPGARAHPFFFPTIRAGKRPMKSKMVRAGSKAAKKAAAVR
jgi:hypothetical protein